LARQYNRYVTVGTGQHRFERETQACLARGSAYCFFGASRWCRDEFQAARARWRIVPHMRWVIAFLVAVILGTIMFGSEPVKVFLGVGVGFAILMCLSWAIGTFLTTVRKALGRRSKKEDHEPFWGQQASVFSESFLS
jgi:hypothetical protein